MEYPCLRQFKVLSMYDRLANFKVCFEKKCRVAMIYANPMYNLQNQFQSTSLTESKENKRFTENKVHYSNIGGPWFG